MKINYANYNLITDYKYNTVDNKKQYLQPHFCGLKFHITNLKDIFQIPKVHYINELTGITAGEYGTVCKGSVPMQKFFLKFKSKKDIERIKRSGLSTNDAGCAYSFLKAKANRPLSTSFVHDCSVMYLYNEKHNTHFLYHIHKDENKQEISAIIKLFMPEGYTHASIVPGDKYWSDTHQKYLPEIFSALKNGSDNVKISVFHDSSERPEIVGYMGEMYEITNKFYSKPHIGECGQATFPIRDFRIYSTIYEANSSTDIKELQKKKFKIKHSNQYTHELRAILYKIIDDRINGLRELEKIKTEEELNSYLKTKGMDYIYGYPQTGKAGYYSAVNNKKAELGIEQ